MSFELSTAQKLAEAGLYVIVYDRRGEGRSKDNGAKFTFKQTFSDLNAIYSKYKIKKATLLGHSFGGVVAILFAEKYPKQINSLILISAPIDLQETFKTILASTKAIYKVNKDKANLGYIAQIEKMDKSSLQYSSYTFAHALQNGFYTPKNRSAAAKRIYASLSKSPLSKYLSELTYEAPQGFWKKEKYTTLNLKKDLAKLVQEKVKVYALYGEDDGLYSKKQVEEAKSPVGIDNIEYLADCSHSVFIDQQSKFITAVRKWVE